MAKTAKSRPAVAGVASAERALQVLVAFKNGDGPLELAELAQRTGLVKSTIMRLAVSLEQYGFLVRTLDGRYTLGGEIVRLATMYSERHEIAQYVVPILEYLARETQETATFWIQEGDHRRCLYRVNSPLQLRLELQPGTSRPMDASSAAQVLRNFSALGTGLGAAKLPYYTAGVTTPHVASMSVPVFEQDGRLAGALTLSGPEPRLTKARAREFGGLLLRLSQDLSRRLGGMAATGSHDNSPSTPAKNSGPAKPRVANQPRSGRKRG